MSQLTRSTRLRRRHAARGGTDVRPIRIALHRQSGRDRGPDPRTCARLGIRAIVRPRTARMPWTSSIDAVVAAAATRAAPTPSTRVRLPGRERRLRRGGDRGRDPLGRPAAGGDPGDGRQGGGAAARAVGSGVPVLPGYDDDDQSDGRWRRRRPRSATRCSSSRRPAAAARACGWSATRDRLGMRSRRHDARRGAPFGDDRLILERLLEGARHVEVQVLFDGHGARRPSRRARLLDPAPPPEGPRGDAVAGGRRRRSGARLGDAALALARRGRLRERRDVRVPARRPRRASRSSR